MFRLEFLFVLQLVIGIILIVVLRKIMQMKKQVDTVIEEVKNYIQFVTEEEQENPKQRDVVQNHTYSKHSKAEKDEMDSKLIQVVLGEYFL